MIWYFWNGKKTIFIKWYTSAKDCDGDCGLGEGDCDWDRDCLPGLVCDFDWFWGDDFCAAGKCSFELKSPKKGS